MHDNDNHDPDDPVRSYKVGKGKAPMEHRFEKGKPSANPFGRPRKKRKSEFQARSDALVSLVTEIGDGVVGQRDGKDVTRLQYVLEGLAADAM